MRLSPAIPVFRLLTLGNGDQIISGAFVATVTNLDNGTSTHINLSGQRKFDAATGVYRLDRGTILIDTGAPLYVHGPIVFDASGGRTIISGSVTDMCAVLSGPSERRHARAWRYSRSSARFERASPPPRSPSSSAGDDRCERSAWSAMRLASSTWTRGSAGSLAL